MKKLISHYWNSLHVVIMLFSITLYALFGVSWTLVLPPLHASILDELSWTLKLKLLKDFLDYTSFPTPLTSTIKRARRVGIGALVMADSQPSNLLQGNKNTHKSIYINNALAVKDPSEYLRHNSRFDDMNFGGSDSNNVAKTSDNSGQDTRRLIRTKDPNFRSNRHDPKLFPRSGLGTINNSSKKVRRQEGDPNVPSATSSPEDENNMRMKLFRLMYETVRDSDLKVKRAELIRSHYHNSSTFEIGYLIGDITDKYNIMHDIATTLERLYHDWKPLEHINAYEQIANQAIQISHLIDMVRHISKYSNSTG